VLKGVLADGPHAERPRFDPKAAAAKALDEVRKAAARNGEGNGDAGAGAAKTPWEVDGRRWHCRDRVARNGRPVRWDGQILGRVVDRVVTSDPAGFAPPDWSQRSLVKVHGTGKGSPVLFTAITGNEWVLTLKFRVPRGAFKAEAVEDQLKLTPFHQATPPVLSDAPRVSLMSFPGGWQEVVITACADDLDTPAFEAFLARAVGSFRKAGKVGGLVTASELT
jgi:excinuclease ABC subunit A